MKICTLALIVFLTGCSDLLYILDTNLEPVYKYNTLEMRHELTHPESKLKYNVFEKEWMYVR